MDPQKRDRLMKLVREHAVAEAAGDIDAIMATVTRNNPLYEWYPLGYRTSNWDTIGKYYNVSLNKHGMLNGRITVDGYSGSFGELDVPEDIFWFGKNSLVVRDDLSVKDENGVARSMRHYAVFGLADDNLLSGEIMMTTAYGGHVMAPVLEECFNTLPGIEKII